MKRLNYTNIRCNLPKNKVCFSPWFLHLYIKKWLWQYFSKGIWSRVHLHVEIYKLHWLKQFDMDHTWFDPPWSWSLVILTTSVTTKFAIFKRSQFCTNLLWNVFERPYLILKSFTFTSLKQYLPKNSFYPLIYKSICKQRTLAIVFLLFVVINKLDFLK